MIKASGRSWWQCRYSNGTILSEWDTLTGRILLPRVEDGGTGRWEDIEKRGMIGLRLLCPNGQCGELQASEGYKFFQLKVGTFGIGCGHDTISHIIGVVENINGGCLCRVWDGNNLIEFRDNVCNMKYQNIGTLSIPVQGLRV
jgi:hypothetical protein